MTAVVLGASYAVPAHAAPPTSICPAGRGLARDLTYQGVRVHSALPCQWLDTGTSWALGSSRLVLENGNLMVRDRTNAVRWESRTRGSGATQMVFQHDGNLVLYTPGWARAVWATGTVHKCGIWPTTIGLQSDGNFVIYCRYYHADTNVYEMYPIWDTGTH
jgi:hypothetical protein